MATILDYSNEVPLIEIDVIKQYLRKLYELVDEVSSNSNHAKQFVLASEELIDSETDALLDAAESQFATAEMEKQIADQEEVLEEQMMVDKQEPEIPDEKTITKVNEESLGNVSIEFIDDEIQAEVEEVAKTIEKNITEIVEGRTVYVLDVMPDEDEELASSKAESKPLMSSNIKLKAIKSLKNGIGINDKFMIINDLFEGSTKDYNESIQALDSQKDMQSALFLLHDMRDENQWDSKDTVFLQLQKYVERRYI
jgi:hypothetical protein